MDDALRQQRDASLARLEDLIRRGRRIRSVPEPGAARAWQADCAAAVHQLSGGSKAHWLARGYSGAFLVGPGSGGVVLEVDTAEIVDRILGVLAEGAASLAAMDDLAAPSAPPAPRQFDFVHDAALRPVLERSFAESRDALLRGEFARALVLSCGVLEALLADALEHARDASGAAPGERPADGSFERRIAAAESAGLVRGGCRRLPPVALRYRDLADENGAPRSDAAVSERDARLAGQVLRVVMKDLDPGR